MKFITVFVAIAAAAASAQALSFDSQPPMEARSNPNDHHIPQQLSRRSPGHRSHHVSNDEQMLSSRANGHHHQGDDQYLTARSDVMLEFTTRELVEELEARLDIERRGKKLNWIKKKLGFGGGHSSQQQQQQSGGYGGSSGGDDSMEGAPSMV